MNKNQPDVKTAAILCAQGLGDALLMMIVAHQLKQVGYVPTLFHDQGKTLEPLFENVGIQPYPKLDQLEMQLSRFDKVILENDHSKRAWHLFGLRESGKLDQLTVFFPTASSKKHSQDYLFDPKLPVASNLQKGCLHALELQKATKENGIFLPEGTYRHFSKRIVIHPTSNDKKRNWFSSQYLQLAKCLKQDGFEISFTVSPKERPEWERAQEEGFLLPYFSNLRELSVYLFESGYFIGNDSGIGHLASNLKIPTLTISGNPKRIKLWRPDWYHGSVVTIPFPLPNFKGIGLTFRDDFWQHFIPVKRTLKAFYKLMQETK